MNGWDQQGFRSMMGNISTMRICSLLRKSNLSRKLKQKVIYGGEWIKGGFTVKIVSTTEGYKKDKNGSVAGIRVDYLNMYQD